ncbi:MAG: rhodanese-like domain-containing protein [Nitrospinota bacterium]
MDRKKKIYIQYTVIFILIILLGIINFLIKTSDIWRSSLPAYEYKTISQKELGEMMSSNNELIIVDTRIKEDFEKGHIKGAISLPYTNFKYMEKSLKGKRDKEIIIYSEDGDRSKKIGDILSNLGFSKIRNLDGGINAWINSGGKVVI